MANRSPQADNWLRRVGAISSTYQIAIVPEALKTGYIAYFNRFRIHHKVAETTFTFEEVKQIIHAERFEDMQNKWSELIVEFPQLGNLYNRTQYIIYSNCNNRPIPQDFDEDELLQAFRIIAAQTDPDGPPFTYANAVRYNLGNNNTRDLPIPSWRVTMTLPPPPALSFSAPWIGMSNGAFIPLLPLPIEGSARAAQKPIVDTEFKIDRGLS